MVCVTCGGWQRPSHRNTTQPLNVHEQKWDWKDLRNVRSSECEQLNLCVKVKNLLHCFSFFLGRQWLLLDSRELKDQTSLNPAAADLHQKKKMSRTEEVNKMTENVYKVTTAEF